jgi:hypothetical protein
VTSDIDAVDGPSTGTDTSVSWMWAALQQASSLFDRLVGTGEQ